ncbi:MAG TPA: VCBS repeat-containing protein, partial [Thermomicrobiales bacterium]|nr:VCBS repeat-containing protein [Thermomicrobiales bacterium]
ETLQALRQLLTSQPWLAENIRRRAAAADAADPLAWVDEASAAAKRGQWPAVQAPILALAAAVRDESWSLEDRRRVEPDPLEYAIYDFRDPCDDKNVDESPPIEVKLNELASPQQLPPLLGLNDIKLADFDLDGRLDVVALRETSIEVYGRAAGSDEWRAICRAALPASYRCLLLADLDQDDPEPLPSARRPSCHRAGLDAAVYGDAGVLLLRNVFDAERRTRALQIEPHEALARLKPALALAAVDFDRDGRLDLAASSAAGVSLWSNRGEMDFADVSSRSSLPPAALAASSIVPVDWDGDLDMDLMLAGPSEEPAGYLENLRLGQFRWRAFDDGFSSLTGAVSLALVDDGGAGGWALAASGKAGLAVIRTDLVRRAAPNRRSIAPLASSPRTNVQA